MKQNNRLSAALHVLLHIADNEKPMTSEELATCLGTNPVVVRRTMAGLRDAGLVTSARGHGGGWAVARPLDAVSLADVYDALGEPVMLPPLHDMPSTCLVEHAVNSALDAAVMEAKAILAKRFAEVTLQQLADDFRGRRVRLKGL